MKTYTIPIYAYAAPGRAGRCAAAWPVIVVGAGPVGLDRGDRPRAARHRRRGARRRRHGQSSGSRAICCAKRTLEILDRLGCGERMVAQGRRLERRARCSSGTSWSTASTCCRSRAIVARRSSTCSSTRSRSIWSSAPRELPQLETALAEQGRRRRRSRAIASRSRVATPDGEYRVALRLADRRRRRAQPRSQHARPRKRGAGVPRPLPDRRHPHEVGLSGRALVLVRSAVPSRTSRRCCTGRPTTCGASTSSSAGTPIREQEKKPEHIAAATAGDARRRRRNSRSNGRASTRSSAGACARSATAACCSPATRRTCVSPFGARGANSGIQDADNLVWKLELVMEGLAPRATARHLRRRAHRAPPTRTSSTRRAAPISSRRRARVSRTFRDAVLALAKEHSFARRLVNSGRLSVPAILASLDAQHAGRRRRRFRRRDGSGRLRGRRAGRRTAWRLAARTSGRAASHCSHSARPFRPVRLRRWPPMRFLAG